jgi:LysM repeat protein
MTVQIRSRWVPALAVAAVLAGATPAAAQEPGQLAAPSGRTHTVRTGDTLWDLARMYLGDPFLWPEIYRLNTEVVEDPHWIYPGEVLQLPEGSAVGGIAQTAPGEQQVGDAPPSRAGTVFATRRQRLAGDRMQRGVIGRAQRPLVRPGEWYAAPSVAAEGGIPGSGRIIDRIEERGISSRRPVDRLQHHDRVHITVPEGRTAAVGDRYLSYRLDEVIGDGKQVIVPTAVLRVEDVRPTGEVVAQIVDIYNVIRIDQKVTLMEPFTTTPVGDGPQPVTAGSHAKVAWIQEAPVLPSLNAYLVLEGGASDVKMGDQFTLLRQGMEVSGQVPGPDAPETIAVVQVVKVAPGGITAMVLDQAQPGIRLGVPARLTAKMP